MAKWMLKAKEFGLITFKESDGRLTQSKKGDIFIVETLWNNNPTPQDVAKSVGKEWAGNYGSIPNKGYTKVGEQVVSSSWEVTRLE